MHLALTLFYVQFRQDLLRAREILCVRAICTHAGTQHSFTSAERFAMKGTHYTWNPDFSSYYYQAFLFISSLGTLLLNWFNPSIFLPYFCPMSYAKVYLFL